MALIYQKWDTLSLDVCFKHGFTLLKKGRKSFVSLWSLVEWYIVLMLFLINSSQQLQLHHIRLFLTAWTVARQASLSLTIPWHLLKFMSVESVMLSNHLILCHPLLLPSIFPSIRGLFQWIGTLHQVAKVLELKLQHQSFQWVFRVVFL